MHHYKDMATKPYLDSSKNMMANTCLRSLTTHMELGRNFMVKSCVSSRFWLILERLITTENKNLIRIGLDLQPKRFLVMSFYKQSCSKLKTAGVPLFHDLVTIQWKPGLSMNLKSACLGYQGCLTPFLETKARFQ